MPKVTIAGCDLFYVCRRAAESGEPLLFIHGAGGTHSHWGHQLTGLARVNRCALDLPGHGRSGGSGQSSISGYGEVILQFMDALGIDRATLAGHSMGGAVCLHLALSHPSRVHRLILVGSGARLRVLPSLLEGMLSDFPATVEDMLGWAFSNHADAELIRAGKQEWLENEPRVVHDDFAACDLFDVMDRLDEIRCPTLVLCGGEDMLTPPKYASYLAEHIPDATLVIIPQAGHMVMLEQPELVNQAIGAFVVEEPGQTGAPEP
jgi:pimeloyl-ACP methyl ester carboxylesterase